jgi:tight adherence protein C
MITVGTSLAVNEFVMLSWVRGAAQHARRISALDLGMAALRWVGRRQREWPPMAWLADKIHDPATKWLGARDPGADAWLAWKEALFLGGLVLGLVLLDDLVLGLVFGLVAVVIPDLLARDRYLRRQEQIRRDLPDVLDLLTLSLGAGLSIDAGLAQVADKYRGGVLADAIGRMLGKIRFGARRHEAWRTMAANLGNPQVSEVVAALIQADAMGVGLVQALKGLAGQARTWHRQQIEELAQKAPVKMLFPLVLFIFPAIFIVLLGPILMQLSEVIK